MHLRGRENILKRLVVHSGVGEPEAALAVKNYRCWNATRLAGARLKPTQKAFRACGSTIMLDRNRRLNDSGQIAPNDFRRRVKIACFTSRC